MPTQPEEAIARFNIGDYVRANGKPQVLKIIESRTGIPHVYMELVKKVHYKCEWRSPKGLVCTEWFEGGMLERAR